MLLALATVTLVAAGIAIARGDDREGKNDRAEGPSFSASCASMVELDGRVYLGNAVDFPVSRSVALGVGRQPNCRRQSEESEPDAGRPHDVEVWSIAGVDPEIAVAPANRHRIYAAPGRCVGFEDDKRFERCLRGPLEFNQTRYIETRLFEPVAIGETLGVSRREACCEFPAEDVALAAIKGGSTQRGVATEDEPTTVWVAIDQCLVDADEELRRCLGAEPAD